MSQILNEFEKGFLDAALMYGHDIDEWGGILSSFDEEFEIEDIHPDTIKDAIEDCEGFRDMDGVEEAIGISLRRAGIDFFLTRNGHGAGFWDGDWPEKPGWTLTKCAKTFGTWELQRSLEDGKIVLRHHG